MQINKLAIANRGEVAARIIMAAQELGIKTALLHSEADINSLAYEVSDETVCIGPSAVNESYLNIDSNIQGALSCGADAIHPGFGFLSENANFSQACVDNKMIFVGPKTNTIKLFGDKISAKNLVESIDISVISGDLGENQDETYLLNKIKDIGLPAMIKVAGGGGGRGLRIIQSFEEAKEALESAKREGFNAFGSDVVFIEKYLDKAKHIEVQIFCDSQGEVFHLHERECSIQRRHQKIIEEAPSSNLDSKLKTKILNAAVKIAKKANYIGAGTVEFLVQDSEFFFLEMNTRLQVEHPVTELYTGIDLVKAQLLTAQDKPLLWDQESIQPTGHSIECRIYAEDPYNNGVPSIGTLGHCYYPLGPGRRFEIGFREGDEITSYYDSMIAKIVVWDENRPRAIKKMIQTLKKTIIFGVKTNIPYLLRIIDHPEFVDGSMTTQFISNHFPNGLEEKIFSTKEQLLLEKAHMSLSDNQSHSSNLQSPWNHGWESSN